MDSTHPWAQGFQSYLSFALVLITSHGLSSTIASLVLCLVIPLLTIQTFCIRLYLWHNLKEVHDGLIVFGWCQDTEMTLKNVLRCYWLCWCDASRTQYCSWAWVMVFCICFIHFGWNKSKVGEVGKLLYTTPHCSFVCSSSQLLFAWNWKLVSERTHWY